MSESLQFPGQPEVKLVRRKRQKYLRIRIKPGQVIISGPKRCSKSKMLQYARENSEWINRNLEEVHRTKEGLKNKLAEKDGFIQVRGEWKPITLRRAEAAGAPDVLRDKGVIVEYHTRSSRKVIPNEVAESFYRRLGRAEIPARCRKLAEHTSFDFDKVYIRAQKTKWGSCSSRRNLSFNWRLMKCPPWIIDYLIVHELCHLKEFNHSPRFWALVDRHYPRRREAEAWLKEHEALLFQDRYVVLKS